MATTTLPGFKAPVHQAQQTFRALLAAIAQPGECHAPNVSICAPQGLTPLCAAACLTLFDLETTVWLQPSCSSDGLTSVQDWLQFHTGCRFSDQPQAATFAVIADLPSAPELKDFNWGSAEDPEQSTTLLIQVPDLTTGSIHLLSGPGILASVAFAPAVPPSFWQQWRANHSAYPQGVDCFFFSPERLVGLPRTVQLLEAQ
ncbi:MAG: phosphonate C-P lyase system protein PhnH [Phormidesmis sp. RL_2_1]|nr:phosphonate C-P lyase system protein PhnH [Phormidesmis sp. RL_2_1]